MDLFRRTLAEMAAATSVHVVAIIEPIIQHADWFFPGGKNFFLSFFCCKAIKHLAFVVQLGNIFQDKGEVVY